MVDLRCMKASPRGDEADGCARRAGAVETDAAVAVAVVRARYRRAAIERARNVLTPRVRSALAFGPAVDGPASSRVDPDEGDWVTRGAGRAGEPFGTVRQSAEAVVTTHSSFAARGSRTAGSTTTAARLSEANEVGSASGPAFVARCSAREPGALRGHHARSAVAVVRRATRSISGARRLRSRTEITSARARRVIAVSARCDEREGDTEAGEKSRADHGRPSARHVPLSLSCASLDGRTKKG